MIWLKLIFVIAEAVDAVLMKNYLGALKRISAGRAQLEARVPTDPNLFSL